MPPLNPKSPPEGLQITPDGALTFLKVAEVLATIIQGKMTAVSALRGEAERLGAEKTALESRAKEVATRELKVTNGDEALARRKQDIGDRELTMVQVQRNADAQRAENERRSRELAAQDEDLRQRTAAVEARSQHLDALQARVGALLKTEKGVCNAPQ